MKSRSNSAYVARTSARTASGSFASRIALPCENTSTQRTRVRSWSSAPTVSAPWSIPARRAASTTLRSSPIGNRSTSSASRRTSSSSSMTRGKSSRSYRRSTSARNCVFSTRRRARCVVPCAMLTMPFRMLPSSYERLSKLRDRFGSNSAARMSSYRSKTIVAGWAVSRPGSVIDVSRRVRPGHPRRRPRSRGSGNCSALGGGARGPRTARHPAARKRPAPRRGGRRRAGAGRSRSSRCTARGPR